ncbi:hypothetical protein QQ008_18875 [Fulvivirgaceae bacterium BMA10]|uniref:Uncharacterized protein n=1 Tax=Splendidivirga corallicola TaxID=3051826 RepID=A0ABT8KSR8_9BACT|nr:hypothetical protein [Fulvivirgaceae bacterium BMA10]
MNKVTDFIISLFNYITWKLNTSNKIKMIVLLLVAYLMTLTFTAYSADIPGSNRSTSDEKDQVLVKVKINPPHGFSLTDYDGVYLEILNEENIQIAKEALEDGVINFKLDTKLNLRNIKLYCAATNDTLLVAEVQNGAAIGFLISTLVIK